MIDLLQSLLGGLAVVVLTVGYWWLVNLRRDERRDDWRMDRFDAHLRRAKTPRRRPRA